MLDVKSVVASLNSSVKKGLSAAAAKINREMYGLNLVPEPASDPSLIFLSINLILFLLRYWEQLPAFQSLQGAFWMPW